MKTHIDIKKPCSQNWEAMTPTQRGAFCESCALEVHDFTKKSGDEIRDILKLNLGSRVCGKIKPSQLNALNVDFKSWQMNSKRSFQSALVFSLIVAFGMTLFSCEEEEESKKIGSIQQVGMSFLTNFSESSFYVGNMAQRTTPAQSALDVAFQIPELPIEVHEVRQAVYHDDIRVAVDRNEYKEDYDVLGGMHFSDLYLEHLELVNIYDHSTPIEEIMFEAFTYPNPAREQTTLRIILPSEVEVAVQLFSMNGQLLRTIASEKLPKGENNFPIDLLDIPNGTYIIAIRSDLYKESVTFVKM